MKRIDTSTKAVDLFGAGKHGFKNGNKALAIAPTDFDASWTNSVQEELSNLIELSGGTLDPNDNTQIYSRILSMINGGDYKASVRIASTANIAALSGLAAIDGVVPVVNDRVLLKDQTTGSQNGIYLAAAGAWTRASDADTGAELNGGAIIPVEAGTVNADTNWQITNDGVVTIGTTGLTFEILTKTGVTAAQFDNTTKLATTEFVQYVGLKSRFLSYNATTTLSVAAFGATIQAFGSGPFTLTLPSTAGILSGTKIEFENDCGAGNITVASGSANISFNGVASSVSSFVLGLGDTITLTWAGSFWLVTGGSLQLGYSAAFASLKTAGGYQTLPGGLIIQWVLTSIIATATNLVVTLPITFPNACLHAYTTVGDLGADIAVGNVSIGQIRARTTTDVTIRNLSSLSRQFEVLAIGY